MPLPTILARRGDEFQRVYTAGVSDFGDWAQLEPLFATLEAQLAGIAAPAELAAWLLRESELGAVLDEEYARRYIAMTCATDDSVAEAAYLHYLEHILPKIKPWQDKISRAYLANPARQQLDRARHAVLDRALENQVKLFREENIPLQTEEGKLGQQYQKICGAQTVQWRGEEKTLQQMAPFTEDPERPVREEAWRAVASRRLQDAPALNGLFDQLAGLRVQIARNAGFQNYRDYKHAAYNRFDYTPTDCLRFHDAIEEAAVPLLARLRERRQTALGVDTLRPWDLNVDPANRPPLRPFENAAQLEQGCAKIFDMLSPRLGGIFRTMREQGLLDLGSRKGKAPGGYQSTLEEVRLPFIFMNAAGTNRDVFTLLHEGGHAFHAYAARNEPLLTYRSAPMEFCEVASMSMELFGLDHLREFYPSDEDLRRARQRHFEDLLGIFPWIATIDAFQQAFYCAEDQGEAARARLWLGLEERFSPGVDWRGLDDEHRTLWHRQLHLFEVPFYYIEYGIAQLGALQLWLIYREDPQRALELYWQGLALGGSRPLPELFAAAGIRFDFSVETIAPIMQAVAAELDL